jgi:hypothetical protein
MFSWLIFNFNYVTKEKKSVNILKLQDCEKRDCTKVRLLYFQLRKEYDSLFDDNVTLQIEKVSLEQKIAFLENKNSPQLNNVPYCVTLMENYAS